MWVYSSGAWTQLVPADGSPVPVARMHHTLTAVKEAGTTKLVLVGGVPKFQYSLTKQWYVRRCRTTVCITASAYLLAVQV